MDVAAPVAPCGRLGRARRHSQSAPPAPLADHRRPSAPAGPRRFTASQKSDEQTRRGRPARGWRWDWQALAPAAAGVARLLRRSETTPRPEHAGRSRPPRSGLESVGRRQRRLHRGRLAALHGSCGGSLRERRREEARQLSETRRARKAQREKRIRKSARCDFRGPFDPAIPSQHLGIAAIRQLRRQQYPA